MASRSKKKAMARGQTNGLEAGQPISERIQISLDPIYDDAYLRLTKEQKIEMADLVAMLSSNPTAAVPLIEAAIRRYPELKQLWNYLSMAYFACGKPERAFQVAIETNKLFPDYLFGKINYCNALMSLDQHERVLEVFQKPFLLTVQEPTRKVFHLSEVVAFLSLIARYSIREGQVPAAKYCLKAIEKLAPGHSAIAEVKREIDNAAIIYTYTVMKKAGERFEAP